MKKCLSEIGLMILITALELFALAVAASMMALTVFIAWEVVLNPVLGLPSLTIGQIFICAWAFLFCIFCADQVHYYLNPIGYEVEVEETTVEKEENDNDKKS